MTTDLATRRVHRRPVETPGSARSERRDGLGVHLSGMTDYLATTTADADFTARQAADPIPATMLLKLDEVARELRCTRRSLERQIAARRLAVVHIGRSVRVERSELEGYLDRLRTEEHDHEPSDDRG